MTQLQERRLRLVEPPREAPPCTEVPSAVTLANMSTTEFQTWVRQEVSKEELDAWTANECARLAVYRGPCECSPSRSQLWAAPRRSRVATVLALAAWAALLAGIVWVLL